MLGGGDVKQRKECYGKARLSDDSKVMAQDCTAMHGKRRIAVAKDCTVEWRAEVQRRGIVLNRYARAKQSNAKPRRQGKHDSTGINIKLKKEIR